MLQILESMYELSTNVFDHDAEIDLVWNQLADYLLALWLDLILYV